MLKKIILISFCLHLTLLFSFYPASASDNLKLTNIDSQTIQKGYILQTTDKKLQLILPPQALAKETKVKFDRQYKKEEASNFLFIPHDLYLVSDIYQIDFGGLAPEQINKSYKLRYSLATRQLSADFYFFDRQSNNWKKIDSSLSKTNLLSADFSLPFAQVAILRPKQWLEGQTINLSLIPARSAMVIDNNSKVLLAKNSNQPLPLASLTKLMTVNVFLQNNPGWSKIVTIKESDYSEPAEVGFKAGQKVSVKDLFYATLVGSKNDAAKALARSTGLSEKQFINQMNQRGESLGMKATKFVDVTGLDENNRSTLVDYSLLVTEIFKNENVRRACQTKVYKMHVINDKTIYTIKTTDELLTEKNLNIIAAKTGYTEEAGYNFIVQSHDKSGQKVTVLLLATPSSETRFSLAKKLLQLGFNNKNSYKISTY